MKGKINGKEFEADEFGFDGCHKVYLVIYPTAKAGGLTLRRDALGSAKG